MLMTLEERIAQLLEEKYAGDEMFQDCYTVEIDLKPGNQLFIYADADSGLSLEKCQKLSRYVEHQLDENGWLGESYGLEVGSPGIDRPLKFPRQYKKNAGRTLVVTLKDKTSRSGVISDADDQQVVLENTVVERDEKNKKKEVVVATPIPYEQIEKAVVHLGF